MLPRFRLLEDGDVDIVCRVADAQIVCAAILRANDRSRQADFDITPGDFAIRGTGLGDLTEGSVKGYRARPLPSQCPAAGFGSNAYDQRNSGKKDDQA
jgi:hypothetical protein